MDSFDDKMKNLFDDQNSQDLPKGYEWQEMSGPIFEKMEGHRSGKKRRAFWLFSTSALVLLVIGFYWTITKYSTSETNETYSQEKPANMAKVEKKENDTDVSIENNYFAELKNSVANSELESSQTDQIANSTSAIKNDEKSKSVTAVIPSLEFSDRNEKDISLSKVQSSTPESITPDKDFENKYLNPVSIFKSTVTASSDNDRQSGVDHLIALITELPSQIVSLNEKDIADIVSTPLEAEIKEENKSKKKKTICNSSIGVQGGTLLGMGSYTGLTERNDYNTWKPGFHGGLAYAIENSNGWSIDLAYNYDFAVQYFELIGLDTFYLEETVVTRKTTNALTGSVTINTEDRPLANYRDREYQTYNTFKSHSLSMVVHKKLISTGPLSLKAGLGGRVAFLRQSQGYNLDNVGVVSQYTDETLYKGASVDVVGSINLGYSLGSNIDLYTYVNANKSLTNWTIETDVTYKPTLIQVGLGLRYKI